MQPEPAWPEPRQAWYALAVGTAALQLITPNRMRGQITALVMGPALLIFWHGLKPYGAVMRRAAALAA